MDDRPTIKSSIIDNLNLMQSASLNATGAASSNLASNFLSGRTDITITPGEGGQYSITIEPRVSWAGLVCAASFVVLMLLASISSFCKLHLQQLDI